MRPVAFSCWRRLLAVAALSSGLLGCATVEARDPRDPLESWNRSVFRFNEAADRAVLQPAATTYRDVVPRLVRDGISNVYGNFSDAWSAVNSLLQLKPAATAHNTMRVAMNTVFGLGGLLDVATEMGLESQQEDLGQTLARWGLPAGPYLVLPVLGPSTLRDASMLPIDLRATPNLLVGEESIRHALNGLRTIHTRAELLSASEVVEGAALDKYLFMREAYLQRRQSQVHDGNPPQDEREVRWDLEDEEEGGVAAAEEAQDPGPTAAGGRDEEKTPALPNK